jgi:3-methyl-2-oxobutanoate hydroxymethyltransferase
MEQRRTTIEDLRAMKSRGEKITMVTAYDFPTARIADQAGVDAILVGDSLGNVVLGYENTLPVTMDDMVHHTRAAARARPRALFLADLPFLSYQASAEDAVRNAGRLVQEGGAQAVKLEGGRRVISSVRAILDASIPVMGHVGLTPQSVHAMSGYRVQGKDPEAAERLLEDARLLEEAGCFALVLEGVPLQVARRITDSLSIPTIGIGAGIHCDGQVLVFHDVLGINVEAPPKFLKMYAQIGTEMVDALQTFAREVREGRYPDENHSYSLHPPARAKARGR